MKTMVIHSNNKVTSGVLTDTMPVHTILYLSSIISISDVSRVEKKTYYMTFSAL